VTKRVYAGSAGAFDERRNTSRVFAVPPDALPNALRILEAGRGQPWYAWIVKRARGEHDHAAARADGSRAACPVQTCTEPLDP